MKLQWRLHQSLYWTDSQLFHRYNLCTFVYYSLGLPVDYTYSEPVRNYKGCGQSVVVTLPCPVLHSLDSRLVDMTDQSGTAWYSTRPPLLQLCVSTSTARSKSQSVKPTFYILTSSPAWKQRKNVMTVAEDFQPTYRTWSCFLVTFTWIFQQLRITTK